MPLTPGARLGPYSVTAKIGEGGMGEVYQARDTKLDRDVALKVLPEAFTSDPDRLARFEREAKVLASLNHPNIGTIYGLEEAEGVKALVLELIEGPTLADRIKQGPIPVDEALPIAKQIAEALEAAHEAGVIHRDLKPANIKVREDGTVKVLDFGLAKALSGEQSSPDLSQSPTMTATVGGTRAGVILGTAAYMSPEQARGKPLDKRTDIWSFGCVLFEMLTGERAFPGDTVSDTIANVLALAPSWAGLPSGTPVSIRKLLRRCLDKDSRERLRDIGDARAELRDARADSTGNPSDGTFTGRSAAWPRPVVAVSSALLVAAFAGLVGWNLRPTQEVNSRDRFAVLVPQGVRIPGDPNVVTLSPDGRQLVYVGVTDGTRRLYHRPLEEADAHPIGGTDGASNPFFSPDGESVGFSVGATLRKVRLGGGAAATICDFPWSTPGSGPRATWGPDGMIWFGSGSTGLYRVSDSGGVPQQVTTPDADAGIVGHFGPQPLPNGRGVLYSAARPEIGQSVRVYDLQAGEHHTLVEEGKNPWYAASGHIIYGEPQNSSAGAGSGGTLWAVPFDVGSLSLTGPAVRVREPVRVSPEGNAQAYLGRDGTLVFLPGGSPDERTLVWVDRQGNEQSIDVPPNRYVSPRLSPDGDRIAVEVTGGDGADIYVVDVAGGTPTNLTSRPGLDSAPVWHPSGEQIAFARGLELEDYEVWRIDVDGVSPATPLTSSQQRFSLPGSWAADGRTLFVSEFTLAGPSLYDISALRTTGADVWTREPLAQGPFQEWAPEVSRDGQWLAHNVIRPNIQVLLKRYPGLGDGIQVSEGQHPAWSHDSSELFFRTGQTMMAVKVRPHTLGGIENPEPLFKDDYLFSVDGVRDYDVAPDGRFLMVKQRTTEETDHFTVVRDWAAQLEGRAP